MIYMRKECAERIADIANRYNIQIPAAPSLKELQERYPDIDRTGDVDYGACTEISMGLRFIAQDMADEYFDSDDKETWAVVLEGL